MSNFYIALLMGLGATTWVYTKMNRKTGNNARASIVVSAIVGLFVIGIVFVVLGLLTGLGDK